MKKNCNGCRASSTGFYGQYKCDLNYKMESIFNDKCLMYTHGKPLEECPKPKTYEDYFAQMNVYRKESE
jgi:hypothetical protein